MQVGVGGGFCNKCFFVDLFVLQVVVGRLDFFICVVVYFQWQVGGGVEDCVYLVVVFLCQWCEVFWFEMLGCDSVCLFIVVVFLLFSQCVIVLQEVLCVFGFDMCFFNMLVECVVVVYLCFVGRCVNFGQVVQVVLGVMLCLRVFVGLFDGFFDDVFVSVVVIVDMFCLNG